MGSKEEEVFMVHRRSSIIDYENIQVAKHVKRAIPS